jgi:hypothetical protein
MQKERSSRVSRSLGALAAVWLASSAANAQPISFQFTGTVVSAGGAWAAHGSAGSSVTGTFTLELTTPDTNAPATNGSYDLSLPNAGMSVTLGALTVSSTTNAVFNDIVTTSFFPTLQMFYYRTDPTAPGYSAVTDTTLTFLLQDTSSPVNGMTSDDLPTSLDVSTFNTRNGTALLPNGAGTLTYTITGVRPVLPVPALPPLALGPLAAALLASAGLALRRR